MLQERQIAVIGLGYVGLTVAVHFGKKTKIIGFDTSAQRIGELIDGYDKNGEIEKEDILSSTVDFTNDESSLRVCNFFIIIVPTPINQSKQPDLTQLINATCLVGKYVKPGDIVVFESTVYPGATEELCIPQLEKASKLKCGKDFSVAYSPERINPGDKAHTFENICKIVSATDPKTLDIVSNLYLEVVKKVHPVSSIKIAEATKVVENTQRDINISFMNEIALILHHCNLNITEVLNAAETKWNFVPFKPGLVGGHCIGTNSYYLVDKSIKMGFEPHFILAGQQVNDYFVHYLADEVIKNLILLEKPLQQTKIGVLGVAYKENYPDFYDSRVIDLIKKLESFDLNVISHDPLIDYDLAKKAYSLSLVSWDELKELDALIIAVAHHDYCELNPQQIKRLIKPNGLIMDIKGILDPKEFENTQIRLWTI